MRVSNLMIHILSALSFGTMILYVLLIILHPAPKIPELSTGSSNVHISVIDGIGLAICIAGIIVTLTGSKMRRPNSASAGTQAPVQVNRASGEKDDK